MRLRDWSTGQRLEWRAQDYGLGFSLGSDLAGAWCPLLLEDTPAASRGCSAPSSVTGMQQGLGLRQRISPVLSNRTFCEDRCVLHLCDPVWPTLATRSY